uniref:Uncharacterized protein n=1 Tax=Arundo donax TaxID=35708 RepID=A0A0A9D3X8_ARUDO
MYQEKAVSAHQFTEVQLTLLYQHRSSQNIAFNIWRREGSTRLDFSYEVKKSSTYQKNLKDVNQYKLKLEGAFALLHVLRVKGMSTWN